VGMGRPTSIPIVSGDAPWWGFSFKKKLNLMNATTRLSCGQKGSFLAQGWMCGLNLKT